MKDERYEHLNGVVERILIEYGWCKTRRDKNRVYRMVRDAIGNRDGHICGVCGEFIYPHMYPMPDSPSLDHILPKSLGGLTVAENLQITHLRCNQSKGNRVREDLLA